MVDRNSETPLYQQLKDWILNQIETGVWKEGDVIPPERELAAAFGVNRMTVRQALQMLACDGRVARKRGKGTVVIRSRIKHPLHQLTSFTEDICALGRQARSRVLKMEIRRAEQAEAKALQLDKGSLLVMELRRLRLADDVPIGIEHAILPYARCRSLTEVSFQEFDSLYRELRRRCGIELAVANQIIEATSVTPEHADLLGVPLGTPVLRMERTTFDLDGNVIEWVISHYRSDRYQFHVELPIS